MKNKEKKTSWNIILIIQLFLMFISSCSDNSLINPEEICPSNLSGSYDYVTPANSTSCFGNIDKEPLEHEKLTGVIDIIDLGENVFTISDWSFGAYKACYENRGNQLYADYESLTFRDSCNFVIFNGTDLDSFGDLWKINSIIEGKEWRIQWSNTLESGESVILNPDGWMVKVKQ